MAVDEHCYDPLSEDERALAQSAFKAHCRFMRYHWGPRRAKFNAGFDKWELLSTVDKRRWLAIGLGVEKFIDKQNRGLA